MDGRDPRFVICILGGGILRLRGRIRVSCLFGVMCRDVFLELSNVLLLLMVIMIHLV